MIHCPPILRYLPIFALLCTLAFGCSRVDIDDAARAKPKQEALQVSRDPAIRPFSPIKEYSETIMQARELGLISGNEGRGGTVATENNTYVPIGTTAKQYRAWRQMIADICLDSR